MKGIRNRRYLALLLALAMLIGFAPGVAKATGTEPEVPQPETKQLMILHTNDEHGYIEYVPNSNIGYPLYKSAINAYKQDAGMPVLVVNAGDALQGSNLANFSKGADIVPLMNDLGVMAFVPGNHEYDYGKAEAAANHAKSDFSWLASNIFNASDNSLVYQKGLLYPIDDPVSGDSVQVGIFGLATPETKYKAHPANTEGLNFPSTVEENVLIAQAEVDRLKKDGADFIVMLSHLGTDLASEVRAQKIAEQVTGIDVIIDGHSHSEWPAGNPVGNSTIVSAGDKLRYVGKVVLTNDGTETTVDAKLLNEEGLIAEHPDLVQDAEMQEQIDAINAKMGEEMNVVIGKSAVVLDGERANVRTGETNLGDLITDAMLEKSGADLVLTNGGGIRASIPAGEITKSHVFTVLPFGNMLYTIEVTGQQVLDALNFGVSDYPNAAGKFPHIAGMKVEIKEGTPTVVSKVTMDDGSLLDPAKTYTLATNDFMSAGGDGYTMFKGATVVTTDGALDVVAQEYISKLTAAVPEAGFTYETDGRMTLAEDVPVQTGLVADETGLKYIDPETEEPYVNRWKTVDEKTYYFGKDGYAVTGLQIIADVVHYFDTDGVQYKNRWRTVDNKTYYFNEHGIAVKGLQVIAGVTHYFDGNGVQYKNRWRTVDNKTYYFNEHGIAVKGLRIIANVTHYFGADGVQYKNRWRTVDNKTYYFNEHGIAVKGLRIIAGVTHYFGADGVQYKNRWRTEDGKTYLFNEHGIARKGLFTDTNGATYYFDNHGVQLKNGSVTLHGVVYHFNANGVLIK